MFHTASGEPKSCYFSVELFPDKSFRKSRPPGVPEWVAAPYVKQLPPEVNVASTLFSPSLRDKLWCRKRVGAVARLD
jgi:hypothetical protein